MKVIKLLAHETHKELNRNRPVEGRRSWPRATYAEQYGLISQSIVVAQLRWKGTLHDLATYYFLFNNKCVFFRLSLGLWPIDLKGFCGEKKKSLPTRDRVREKSSQSASADKWLVIEWRFHTNEPADQQEERSEISLPKD